MTFSPPLSREEKWYIVEHPDDSHGDIAFHLNRLFHEENYRKRSRITVYIFRNSKEYRDMLAQNAPNGKDQTAQV